MIGKVFSKRGLLLLMALLVVLVMTATPAFALNPQPLPPSAHAIQVNINGSPLQMNVAPMIIDGHTMVAMRAIFEALNATVQWNATDKSIYATEGNNSIQLQIGNTVAVYDGSQVTLDVAPMIVDGSTLVPAAFVSKALGALVVWDAANRQVNITLQVLRPIRS